MVVRGDDRAKGFQLPRHLATTIHLIFAQQFRVVFMRRPPGKASSPERAEPKAEQSLGEIETKFLDRVFDAAVPGRI